EEQPDAQQLADAREDEETEREYLRLLYVAMTRARDVLYVAGMKLLRSPEEQKVPKRTWYTIVREALAGDAALSEEGELAEPCIWPKDQRAPLRLEDQSAASQTPGAEPPQWLFRPVPRPPAPPRPLRPSRGLAEPDPLPAPERPPAFDAADAADADALLRGRVVHLLLERLPAVPPHDRAAVAEPLLARELPHDPDLATKILAEVQAVLSDSALADIFAPGSRAELAIAGNLATDRGDFAVSGRIDRAIRDAAGWHIVDFKTNRQVPAAPDAADPAYIQQLALYRRLLMDMEPGASVRASLVWTAAPNVMPVPAALMEKALAKLKIRGNPVP
ncbi:MAG: PD-(D/E)XK nuclease family protein, partial [Pseudomonadales bacterium]|nr:PD-(D/E)XK nuclease family protein [Pseudomonadales bacterium]